MNTQEKARSGEQALTRIQPVTDRRAGKFYVGMVLVAFGIVALGFGPAIIDPSSRKAPLNLAVAMHGIIFTSWLFFFLAQTLLVSAGKVSVHRRMGLVGAFLAGLMIVTGYVGSVAMVRRGFDLSGELNSGADPFGLMILQLGDLLSFGILVTAGIVYRRRVAIHKRLMLLATVGPLMGAPLAHVHGHFPQLQNKGPTFLIALVLLYFAHAVHDRITLGRIHPVSLWIPIALLIWANLRIVVIGPSAAWRELAGWLVQ